MPQLIWTLSKDASRGAKFPTSAMLELYNLFLVHKATPRCLIVSGRPHFVLVDERYIDKKFQFMFNSTTSEYIFDIRNIPLHFNESVYRWSDFYKDPNSPLYLPRYSFIAPSISSHQLLCDRYLSRIMYEIGLSSDHDIQKFYSMALNTYRINCIDLTVYNKINTIILNSSKKHSSVISNGDFENYLSKDQLKYVFQGCNEINVDDSVVKGYSKIKHLLTAKNIYNFQTYGAEGVSFEGDTNIDIFYNDLNFGSI